MPTSVLIRLRCCIDRLRSPRGSAKTIGHPWPIPFGPFPPAPPRLLMSRRGWRPAAHSTLRWVGGEEPSALTGCRTRGGKRAGPRVLNLLAGKGSFAVIGPSFYRSLGCDAPPHSLDTGWRIAGQPASHPGKGERIHTESLAQVVGVCSCHTTPQCPDEPSAATLGATCGTEERRAKRPVRGPAREGRPFPPSQEGESETPPGVTGATGRQPSDMAAQRHPFPSDGAARSDEGGGRRLCPTAGPLPRDRRQGRLPPELSPGRGLCREIGWS
ncbi:hypothetical protein QFZ41_000760 [Luteibacter sp. W1I16]